MTLPSWSVGTIAMPKATTEQNQEVRHRRRVFASLSVIFPVFCFLSAIALDYLLDKKTLLPVLFIGGFFFCIAALIFTISYYRCPVCKQPFARGTTGRGGKLCKNCDTTFDA